jgi:putative FmdB family regulatory protein
VPIYEYRCDGCETRFEEYLPLSTSPPPRCPRCASGEVVRVFSTFATEWLPGDVAWHRLPGKHDLPGGDVAKPSAFISRGPGQGDGDA